MPWQTAVPLLTVAAAGMVPAVIDALAIALAEFGTLSPRETLEPAIGLADGRSRSRTGSRQGR